VTVPRLLEPPEIRPRLLSVHRDRRAAALGGVLSALVASLRMLLVECCPGFADLFDHDVPVVLLHGAFHPRVVVAGGDDKAVAFVDNPLILGRFKVDALEARLAIALAVKRNRALDVVLSSTGPDLLVHRAKGLFIPCRALRKVHLTRLPVRELP